MADAPTRFIVTGAGSGIGRHFVGVLASRGAKVLATDVNEKALEEAQSKDGWPEERVKRFKLDVRSASDWRLALQTALNTFGDVDVLLNVAGYLKPGESWQLEDVDVDRHFDINVKGVVHGTRAVGSHMVKQGRGHIINIGSLASLAPVPGLCLYSASKFAVRGFSIAAAQELKPRGVAVSLVMPDAVQTPMLDLQVDYPEAAMTFSGNKALTVEDLARVVLDEVLEQRPLEVTVPMGRGLLARFADVAPGLVMTLGPMFAKKGRAAQEKRKKDRSGRGA